MSYDANYYTSDSSKWAAIQELDDNLATAHKLIQVMNRRIDDLYAAVAQIRAEMEED